MEEILPSLEDKIEDLKRIYEKINEKKEDLKLKVQKLFTKIRTKINEREDEIYSKIDNKFDTFFFKEELIQNSEKLSKKINEFLDMARNNDIYLNKDSNKICSLINNCINIENSFKNINEINNIIRRYSSINLNVNFIPEESDMSEFYEEINNFGKINYNNFKFKKCPRKIRKGRAYKIYGEEENIITTEFDERWVGTICENKMDEFKEFIWKIKILKSENDKIMIGVAPIDFDINYSSYDDCGWYYYLYNDSLYSGPPHYYCNVSWLKINKSQKKENLEESSFDEEEKVNKTKKKEKKEESSSDDEEKTKKRKTENQKKFQKTKKRKNIVQNPIQNQIQILILKERKKIIKRKKFLIQ